MLAPLVLALLLQDPVASLDAAAQKRDVAALLAASNHGVQGKADPFFFLKGNGPYDVGRKGWRAKLLQSAGSEERYVVFTTPLTSEDRGDQVFRLKDGKLDAYVPETDPLGTRITHQKLECWFDIPNKKATLVNQAEFKRNPGAPSAFLLRFSPCYTVDSITDSGGKPVRFHQAGGVVSVAAPVAAQFAYTIKYTGFVGQPAYAGSISPNEIMLTNDYWYPMIARLPCAYDLKAHTPVGWTAIGQGDLVSTSVGVGEQVTRYHMVQPVTYWSFSAGPYRQHFENFSGIAYGIWSLTLPEDKLELQAELYRPIMEFYASAFGAYPFKRFGAVDSPHYGGGALEAYSFATYGTGWLPDEDAHEPAHTWWGGMINNTYLRSLWNESFANFSAGLYFREAPIGNREERRRAFVQDSRPSGAYGAVPLSDSGADKGPVASALGYGKGAQVLQVLEAELGTEMMVKSMRSWQETHPLGEPGEWEDYEKVVNGVTGADYSWFFDQWVRGPGWVDLEVSDVKWAGGAVSAIARFKGRPYRLTLEAMLQYSDGRRSFASCRIVPGSLGAATISIPSAAKPVLVSFDPWRKLLRAQKPDEVPTELDSVIRGAKKYVQPKQKAWLGNVGGKPTLTDWPKDLSGTFLVASPESSPGMKALCAKVGFQVQKNALTYKGTKVDLSEGGALAVVDLANGKRCVIGLGTSLISPKFGRARLTVFDAYGRMLRGVTEPKTTGFLTFRL